MGGGAWPFLVGGAICLVNSDNERDLNMLTRRRVRETAAGRLLRWDCRHLAGGGLRQ
jgi:hypothetical protein